MNADDTQGQLLAVQTQLRNIVQGLAKQTQLQTRIQQEQFYADLLRLPRYAEDKRLNRHEHKVFSQNGEDGIIDEVFNRIGTSQRMFVEIGVGNGLECNTAYLLWKGWKGLWVDGDSGALASASVEFRDSIAAGSLQVRSETLSAQNVAAVLDQCGVPVEFDLLSLDIDRNTYFLWKALAHLRPRAIVVEYNASIPPTHDWCVNDVPDAHWNGSLYYGASLKAYEKLGTELGYALVGCDTSGVNAFFVREDLVADRFPAPFTAENHYEPARYFLLRRFGHPPRFTDAKVRDQAG